MEAGTLRVIKGTAAAVDQCLMRINWSKLAAAALLGGVFLPLAWWQGGQAGRGAGPEAAPVVRLQVGDCLNADPGATLSGITAVTCDRLHDYEVFGIGKITATSDYDAGRLASEADTICIEAFAEYTGISLGESDLAATHVTPSADSWDAGDRTVVCLVAGPEGPTVGSERASA